MSPYIFGVVVPLLVTLLVRNNNSKKPKRGVSVDVGGEPGLAIRNRRFESPVQSAWEGVATLAELFEEACKTHAQRLLVDTRGVLLREVETGHDGRSFEKLHLGDYGWLSYDRVFDVVSGFASGLTYIGHVREERAAIFADTRQEWFMALQDGCFMRNVTAVTIYASLGEEALCYSLKETEATTVICGKKELRTLVNISGQLDSVKRVIYMDDDIPSDASYIAYDWTITSFAKVVKLGSENSVDADLPLSADVAVIMYTSGSTGLPNGVMVTHGNVLATLSALMTILHEYTSLFFFPLFLVLTNLHTWTKGDATALRPTLMAAVPAILDRVRDGVFKKVNATGGLPKKLFHLAYARRLHAVNGSWFGAWGFEKALWDFLVFRKVRAILGGRIRFILSGSAPLSGDTPKFINICLGAPIGQGYGLTETCAGGTFSDVDDTSVGRVGPPLPCSFIKLIDWPEGGYLTNDSPMSRGEIVIGGPNVTRVDERGMRWFYTGDIGRVHPDGCLEIIDSKKDIVKLQHGEYVEAALVSPFVDNIMVHADPFPSCCVALVVGSQSTLEEWASEKGISSSNFSELCTKEESVKEVHGSLVKEGKKSRLEKFEIPAKIKLLSDPWTPESGLVTAALKLKREAIKKTFDEELLSELYAS
ncbi:hypothetical protein GLYMA_14G149700v4 [Glycine max]|uniref:AMP-dependent synthetase/ligase domain-containing protein n=1 Tax=Glycine max TaxID=3847 RepID=K7M6V7_SOYBN|nr:hypothetical protein GLYMA_14G149700v4 [Glycine max]